MKQIQGRWGKAWHGYLEHFWLSDRKTLCGKTHMLAHHGGTRHARGRGQCKHCRQKFPALCIERQKGLPQ